MVEGQGAGGGGGAPPDLDQQIKVFHEDLRLKT
jgi:hypothetical protein